MPELPEVEHAAARLRAAAEGRTIARVLVRHPSQARTLDRAACRALAGRRITGVARRAKVQLVHVDDGQVVEVHFRMTGDWDIGRIVDDPPAHERVRFEFTDGCRVSLVDGRALSVLRLHAAGALVLSAYGPEPFDEQAFTAEALHRALGRRRGPIKPALLDQALVAGIGNIYAAEACWEAAIHPATPAQRLSRPRVARLVEAIRTVLQRAQGERYHASAAVDAPPAFAVYDRAGAPCPRGDGGTVRRIVQGGRSTYYCARCQRW